MRSISGIQSNHIEFINEIKNNTAVEETNSTSLRFASFLGVNTPNNVFVAPKIDTEVREDSETVNAGAELRSKLRKAGEFFMDDGANTFGIIIFAGGYGSRANRKQSKEFEQLSNGDLLTRSSMFNITTRKVTDFILKHNKMNYVVYFVCSRMNRDKVLMNVAFFHNQIVHKSKSQIYIAYQHELKLLDRNGLESIKTDDTNDRHLFFPSGMGALRKARVIYSEVQSYSLENHVKEITMPKFIYCLGTCNQNEGGIDLEMLGLIAEYKKACVFKCSLTSILNMEVPRVSLKRRQDKKVWNVLQLATYQQLSKDQNYKEFPIWMYNFVFDPDVCFAYKADENQDRLLEFKQRILKNQKQELRCKVAEYTITQAIMMSAIASKCIGYHCAKTESHTFLKTQNDYKANQIKSDSRLSYMNKNSQSIKKGKSVKKDKK